MPSTLSSAQVATYRETGYHFPVDILSAAEARAYRDRLEAFEARQGGPLSGSLRHKSHLLFPWLHELIRDPRILDPVADVLGPNLLCFSSSFFIKEASDPGFVSWHQDATYWGLNAPDVMTVWLAFTPANLVNGCMTFIPGSHHVQIDHRDTFAEHNLLTRGQEIAVEVDEAQAVPVELAAGQASLHHVLLFHGSAPNRSTDRRIGYAIRYIPTHLRMVVGERGHATLVRGVDTHGNFELEPRPEAEAAPAALAVHAAITGEQAKVLYRGTDRESYRA
ncbi:MAG: phytanoyl-CoA dioxygenase family protein [Proteobacteria bacterium]|nr:phytanoyl-CoA dioxygenase family protein [Pseudomonadota bacterium]